VTAPVLPLPLALPVVVQRLLVSRLPSMAGVEVTESHDGAALVWCPTAHVEWNAARILTAEKFVAQTAGVGPPWLVTVRGSNHGP
jgi:hypothetical protein